MMIYNFNTHSINNDVDISNPIFSLTVDTLEIVLDYASKKVLHVQGYLPLIKAEKSLINLPNSMQGDFYAKNIDETKINTYGVYSLESRLPECKKYFENGVIIYDKENGIIKLGADDMRNIEFMQISSNIIIGYDINVIMKCIYIIPDKFTNL